ncbi:unnamed protein product [Coffea canephora]|uniref:Uncharacterized protein n=1 Tax=Coffea canephora TaxID=49390 RepID=A0A068UL29_COFCA|nr:unnamed protein product [Coffea canephora]
MESQTSQSTKKTNQTLPPRRGQIKMKIFKSIAGIVTKASGSKRKNAGPLSSTSTTPHETPSGFNSDADSDP